MREIIVNERARRAIDVRADGYPGSSSFTARGASRDSSEIRVNRIYESPLFLSFSNSPHVIATFANYTSRERRTRDVKLAVITCR